MIARRHLAEVERRIGQQKALRGELRRMLDACGHELVCDCRVVVTLADHSLAGPNTRPPFRWRIDNAVLGARQGRPP